MDLIMHPTDSIDSLPTHVTRSTSAVWPKRPKGETMRGIDPTHRARLVRLFLVSFAPLALIVTIQTYDSWHRAGIRTTVFWIAGVWTIIGFVDAWRLPRGALKKASTTETFDEIQDQSNAVAGYMAAFVLPFVAFEFQTFQDLLVVIVLLLIFLVVFIHTDLVIVNPMLYIAGWRIIRARREHSDGSSRVAIVLIPRTSSISAGQSISVASLGDFMIWKQSEEEE